MGRILAGVLAAATLVAAGAAAGPGAVQARAAAPALPASKLEFGLSNFDAGWLAQSGVPWRYRYQYLAGGVNTGAGWATWNSPAGQFATYYLQATPTGTIPVFTYYMLLQSSGAGGSEADKDFAHLNDPGLMNAYYADFKLLMEKAGAWGGQVVVQVEPDLWGYLEQRALPGDASSLTASVAGSGNPDVAGYPDTVAGFAAGLLHLRDASAPNVAMAVHASAWGSRIDIASSTDPSVDPVAEADKTAAFLSSTGSWDAVFNDVDDHDAGWWENASCSSPPCTSQGWTHWWDPTNTRVPNFNRYLAWVSELHARTGRPQVVWQVPEGNQYYLTMNNTCGHYQDNLAEYFLGHPAQLFAAGLVAVLFGAGNGCQTTNEDGQKDGVTNNGGLPTSDAGGGCNACNTHSSQYPDDDGGYLRVFVGRYYSTPPPAPKTYPGGLFNPVPPVRVLDTRNGTGHSGALASGATVDLDLTGSVPAGATSVTLNVTAASPSAAGYLTVFPAGGARPAASNLNFAPGETVPNLVEVALAGGKVSFFNSFGSTDVVADLAGYTLPGSGAGFQAAAPSRLLDTRESGEPLGAGGMVTVANLPAGASAVVLNVTAVGPTAASYLTAYPAGGTRPTASNLNFSAGETIANRVVVAAGAGGISLYNAFGRVDVVVDLSGWFSSSGAAFTGVAPTRVLDTRETGGTLPAGGAASLPLAGIVPAGARAVVLNVTPPSPPAAGFVTVWPAGRPRPLASDLNLTPGSTTPNLVVVQLGAQGEVSIYSQAGPQDMVVDLLGWYA